MPVWYMAGMRYKKEAILLSSVGEIFPICFFSSILHSPRMCHLLTISDYLSNKSLTMKHKFAATSSLFLVCPTCFSKLYKDSNGKRNNLPCLPSCCVFGSSLYE